MNFLNLLIKQSIQDPSWKPLPEEVDQLLMFSFQEADQVDENPNNSSRLLVFQTVSNNQPLVESKLAHMSNEDMKNFNCEQFDKRVSYHYWRGFKILQSSALQATLVIKRYFDLVSKMIQVNLKKGVFFLNFKMNYFRSFPFLVEQKKN